MVSILITLIELGGQFIPDVYVSLFSCFPATKSYWIGILGVSLTESVPPSRPLNVKPSTLRPSRNIGSRCYKNNVISNFRFSQFMPIRRGKYVVCVFLVIPRN